MSRIRRGALATLLILAACAAPASAHQGDPNYRSVVDRVTPPVPGLQVQVLSYDDRLLLTNRSGRTVVIDGYEGEPYARLLPDGTVQVNRRSPAAYLNEERFGGVPTPPSARADAPPQWQVLDRTGRFEWHDHRMHWMVKGTLPPGIVREQRRQKVFDYRIPLRVGDRSGAILGTLWWVGSPSGFPLPAALSLAALAALGAGLVVVVRRRRARTGVREAW
jgi:hypothetical protein